MTTQRSPHVKEQAVYYECKTCKGVLYVPEEQIEPDMVCPHCETGTIVKNGFGTLTWDW